MKTIGVIGGGAWGTALAQVAGWAGLDVLLQAREPEVVESIRARRVNEAFLPGIVLDDHVSVTSELADLGACDLILAVPPAQHMRSTLAAFAAHHRPGVPVILCSKGIERGSLKLMTEVLAEVVPQAEPAVLSVGWRDFSVPDGDRIQMRTPVSASILNQIARPVAFP